MSIYRKKTFFEGVSILRSLIFVPIESISSEFSKVKLFIIKKAKASQVGKIKNFIDYFENTYMKGSIECFNKLSAVNRLKINVTLTTNVAESFNRTLNSRFKSTKPNICFFVREIRTLQHETEGFIGKSLLYPDQDYSSVYKFSEKKKISSE
ncbi:hypothetical protein DMUE_5400 [Dictyocoela muelleri]|nr:hypothetical protein DMUE_5400 [Dictyocoela muelleri]